MPGEGKKHATRRKSLGGTALYHHTCRALFAKPKSLNLVSTLAIQCARQDPYEHLDTVLPNSHDEINHLIPLYHGQRPAPLPYPRYPHEINAQQSSRESRGHAARVQVSQGALIKNTRGNRAWPPTFRLDCISRSSSLGVHCRGRAAYVAVPAVPAWHQPGKPCIFPLSGTFRAQLRAT